MGYVRWAEEQMPLTDHNHQANVDFTNQLGFSELSFLQRKVSNAFGRDQSGLRGIRVELFHLIVSLSFEADIVAEYCKDR